MVGCQCVMFFIYEFFCSEEGGCINNYLEQDEGIAPKGISVTSYQTQELKFMNFNMPIEQTVSIIAAIP